MTMPLTVPSLMYSGNRRSPKLGIGSPNESFHRVEIPLTHELHGQERVLVILNCRTHRCRCRLTHSSMQAERRKNSWRNHQQDFLGPSRACRCSSSCLPIFWIASLGLLCLMRKSNCHRYFLFSRRTPPPPQASKWQTCCWSYSFGVRLGSPTFAKKPSSQAATVLQLLQPATQAPSIFSIFSSTIVSIVLANCLHRSCPLHSSANHPCLPLPVSREFTQPSFGKLNEPSCPMMDTAPLPDAWSGLSALPLPQDEARVIL